MTPADSAERYDFVWRVHGYTNEYIRFADAKAALVLGVVGGLLGAELAKVGARMALLRLANWGLPEWAAFASMVLLTLSAIAASAAIAPRISRGQPKGLIYWKAIRKHKSANEFSNHLEGQTHGELEAQVSDHLFVLSGIARDKFQWINIAVSLGFIGSLLAVLVIALY